MGKLHELIAAESDVENSYKKIYQEALTTFTKKSDHFMGFIRCLELKDYSRKIEEEAAKEEKQQVTTVKEKLDYFKTFAIRYFDLIYQKELSNQKAVATLEINGEVIAENVPVTFILGLETKLKAIRGLCEAIPTLAPGIKWIKDTSRKDTYITENPEVREKTEKTLQTKIVAPATPEHPAQVEKWFAEVIIVVFRKTIWSGLITPKQKSDLLERIDTSIIACKKARQKANNVEVEKVEIAEKLFKNILGNI